MNTPAILIILTLSIIALCADCILIGYEIAHRTSLPGRGKDGKFKRGKS